MNSGSKNKGDAIVVGAGVGGLAIATFLSRQGFAVKVLEQAQTLGPVGAGILLPPAGQIVLKDLGIYERIASGSASIKSVHVQTSGRTLLDLHYDKLSPSLGAFGTPRSVLFEALRDTAIESGASIIAASKVLEVSNTDKGVQVKSENGEIYESSLAVIADGSNSAQGLKLGLRYFCVEYQHEAIWTIGSIENLKQDYLLQRMRGVSRLSGLLPIGAQNVSFFWGVRKNEKIEDWESFRNEAKLLIPEAASVIDQLADLKRYTRVGYRTTLHYPWFKNNIVLLGDAAHSMSPHLGQGASLALVDAARLAKALADNPDSIKKAFSQYQKDRFWKSLYYVAASLLTSPFFQSDSDYMAKIRNVTLPFMQRFSWIEKQMISTMSGLKARIFKTCMDEKYFSTKQ